MALDFPSNPYEGQIYSLGDRSWRWTGYAWDAVSAAYGPTGPQGPTGPAGPQGITGAQGAQGPQGVQGPKGAQGAEGPLGPQGQQGPAGAQGAQGAQGTAGPKGDQGSVGPEGPQGPRGYMGFTGPQGAQGPQGAKGAQGDAGQNGAQGPTGPQGPQGDTGPQGSTGPQPSLSNDLPQALGTASAGTDTVAARDDHVHPTTGLALLNSANAFTVGGHTITNAAGAQATIPLTITAASGQTNDMFRVNFSGGSSTFKVDSNGGAILGSAANGVNGTISGTNFAVIASGSTVIPLRVRGTASQTANLQEWQDSGGTVGMSVDPYGQLTIGQGSGIGAKLNIKNNVATTIGAIVRGAASQTANLQEWQNSAGAVAARVDFGGAFSARYFTSLGNTTGSYIDFGADPMVVWTRTAGSVVTQIRGITNQTADLVQWQTYDGATSTVRGGANALAQTFTGSTAPITVATGGATTAASGTGTVATITTTSAHGLATGDLVTVAGVTPTGYNGTYLVTSTPTTTSFTYANTTTGSQTVAGTVSVPAQTSITARSAGTVGLSMRASSGQVARLAEWRDSSGNLGAWITAGATFSGDAIDIQFLRSRNGSLTAIWLDGDRNVAIGGGGSYGGGKSVTFLANATTVPTTNPTGGGILYSESGALKWRGSGGAITTIANATDGDVGSYALLGSANAFTVGGHTITSQSSGVTPLSLVAASGQTANLLNIGSVTAVDSAGRVYIRSNAVLSSAELSVGGTNPGIVRIVARGSASQTANLQEWQDSAGSVLASVQSSGFVATTAGMASPFIAPTAASANRFSFFDGAANATPMLSIYGSTTKAVGLQTGLDGSAFVFDSTGFFAIATDTRSALVNGTSGGGTIRVVVSSNGRMGINNSISTPTAQLQVNSSSASLQGAIVRGASSQTANLQEWQNSAGTVLASIGSGGKVSVLTPSPASTKGQVFEAGYNDGSGKVEIDGYGRLFVRANSDDGATLNIGHSGSLGLNIASRKLSNDPFNHLILISGSPSATVFGVNAVGQSWTGSSSSITVATGGATTAASGTGTTATITTTSAHGLAVGDLVTVAGVTPTGYNGTYLVTAVGSSTTFSYANTTTGSQTVAGTVSAPAQASITARSAGTVGLVVKQAASQIADIQQWTNSGGTIIARVDSGGFLRAQELRTISSQVTIREQNSGGKIRFIKATAAATNPGTDQLELYVRDGTNAGTLKLVVRTGTAGAETPILDNIDQSSGVLSGTIDGGSA